MDSIVSYITDNYKWIFSGIGVLVIGYFLKSRVFSINKVNQKNITAGGDVVGRDKKG
jgi:hypothetical protein